MKNKDAFVSTFPLVWIYTFFVGGAIYFIFDKQYAISFLLGSVTSLMTMSMLYRSSSRILKNNVSGATQMATRNYAIRYMLYAIVLVSAGLLEELEIIGVAAGLLSFKIVLYFNLLVLKRGENKWQRFMQIYQRGLYHRW